MPPDHDIDRAAGVISATATPNDGERWRSEARAMGADEFIRHHLMFGTSPRHLLACMFDLRVPPAAAPPSTTPHDSDSSSDSSLSSDDLALWSVVARLVRRLCHQRLRLPQYNSLDHAVSLIRRSRRIIVLTGAGISVSCGIPDFRSEHGIYSLIHDRYPDLDEPQQMFDIHYFTHNPRPFFDLAKLIFPSNFQPSPTHHFIKLLEQRNQLLRNYTQNIDTLEASVGLERVVHCHGSFDTATCRRCAHRVSGQDIRQHIMSSQIPLCPKCTAVEANNVSSNTRKRAYTSNDEDSSSSDDSLPQPILKPDIIFFGEKLPDSFDRAIAADRPLADLLIVIGSSLKVAPVSDLIGFIPHQVPVILINREPVYHFHTSIDINLLGYCDDIVRELCQKLEWEFPEELAKVDDGREKSAPPTHIEPNVTLFRGAIFNGEKHHALLNTKSTYVETSTASTVSEETDDEEEMPRPSASA